MEKIYVGQGKSIETKYGELLKLSLRKEDLDKLVSNLDNGWVNVIVSKRKEPSEKGFTHYLVIDTWKPENKINKSNDTIATIEDLPF